MRFLILTQYYAPEIGAPQVRLQAIARVLQDLGHEVEVVTAVPNYPMGRIASNYRGYFYLRENVEGVTVHRVWVYATSGTGLKRIWNYLSFTLLSPWALWQCLRPDFIFVESPPLFLSIPGFFAAKWWRCKMILNEADFWLDSVKELGLIQNRGILNIADCLETWSFRKADKVNAVTEGIRKKIIEKGIPEQKILFLPNGVNTELFKPRPADEELSRNLNLVGKKIILYAGNLGYMHGLDTVLGAAEILASSPELVFVLIGDGSEKARLQKLSRDRSLNNVIFLPPAPPSYIARLYSLSLAGLATVRNIPLFKGVRSAKMFPAMASGVPVLYSGCGEGARLVEEAEAGLTVPPENPEALAEGVLRLGNDLALAQKLGQNGRRYAENNLRWSTLVGNWLENLIAQDDKSLNGNNLK